MRDWDLIRETFSNFSFQRNNLSSRQKRERRRVAHRCTEYDKATYNYGKIRPDRTTVDSVAFLNTGRGALVRAAVFGGGRAKGTLKILQELLNHGGLVAVVRAGITYLTSKCPAGADSPFRILFHDRTLNHDASVALNDTVSCVLVECTYVFILTAAPFSYFASGAIVKFAPQHSELIPCKTGRVIFYKRLRHFARGCSPLSRVGMRSTNEE